jgi:hypothetical protein
MMIFLIYSSSQLSKFIILFEHPLFCLPHVHKSNNIIIHQQPDPEPPNPPNPPKPPPKPPPPHPQLSPHSHLQYFLQCLGLHPQKWLLPFPWPHPPHKHSRIMIQIIELLLPPQPHLLV